MLKNFFKKINNVIQWSKKYHFFHILAIPSFFYVANIFWFLVIVFLKSSGEPVNPELGRGLGIFMVC